MSSSRRYSSPTWIPRSGDRASRRNVNLVILHRSRASIIRQAAVHSKCRCGCCGDEQPHTAQAACVLFLRYFFECFLLDRGRSRKSLHTHHMCIFGFLHTYLTHFGSYVFRTEPSNTMQTLGGCARNPSAVIRQYSASHSRCSIPKLKCGTVGGQIIVVCDVWF
jgi:hypothetical protein